MSWKLVEPGRYVLPGTDYVITHDLAFQNGWFTVTWKGQKIAEKMRLEWAQQAVARHKRGRR